MRWKMVFEADDMIWFGDATKTDDKYQGLLSQISSD